MNEEWAIGDGFELEQEFDEALPIVMSGDPAELTGESVDDLFANVVSRLSATEAESLGSALRQVGRWAGDRAQLGQIASTVLPTAGAAIGTIYGGPAGMALGRSLGQRAGQAIGPRQASTEPTASPASSIPPITSAQLTSEPAATPAGIDGSQAAAQLLYLVQNPAFLSSLVSLALGSRGQPAVAVGPDGKPVRVAAFVNAANNLASQAAQDADSLAGDGLVSDAYLKDAEGYYSADPANPSERAGALLQLLQTEDEWAATIGEAYEETIEPFFDADWWDN